MTRRVLQTAWATVLTIGALAALPVDAATLPVSPAVARYTLKIVKTYPHDPQAFTEGLFYDHGFLYESTGRNGTSSIRKVNLDSGKVVLSNNVDSSYFGEGITAWGGHIISLTWRSQIGFIWNKSDFQKKSTFQYTGEGWGMTHNAKNLIMSDGTPTVKFLDPNSLKVTKTISVTYGGKPIGNVNELEWVDGEILANVWMQPVIIRINPKSGDIDGVVDLAALPEVANPPADRDAVANGIAYDSEGKRLFITGKLWSHLYQVELVPAGPN